MAFGRRVDPERARFCEYCGTPLQAGDAFCASCGTVIQALPHSPSAPPKASPPPRRRVDWAGAFRKVAAFVLALGVLAAVGLYPLWWSPIAERFATDDARPTIEASDWLTEGPIEPPALEATPLWTTVSAVAANRDAYAGRLVILSGVPVTVEARDGVTLALLSEGDASLVVGHPDNTNALVVDEAATLAGVMSPDGDELLALAASRGVPGDPTVSRSLAHTTLAASVIFVIAAVLLRVRRGKARRAVAPLLAAGALAALLALAGCDITITTTVQPDGSGMVRTRVVTGQETMTELMGLPNAQAFTDSWLATAERRGMRVEQTIDQLKVDREFASVSEFAEGDSADTGSWSRLGQVSLPDGRHTYFLASFDTSSLYPEEPSQGEDTSAYDSLLEELDASTLRYVLDLPGTLVGANASDGTAWDVPMGTRTLMFAESVSAFGQSGNRSAAINRLWADALRWWFALSGALLTWALVAYPWRKKGSSRA